MKKRVLTEEQEEWNLLVSYVTFIDTVINELELEFIGNKLVYLHLQHMKFGFDGCECESNIFTLV